MRKKLLLSLLAAVCCMSMWAQTGPASNEIWYTTSNGEAIADWHFEDEAIDSNIYKDGKGVLTFKEGPLTQIPDGLFYWCEELISVTIPASVQKIDFGAFMDCWSLETVTFAEGSELTEIGESAFGGCEMLSSITLPASLKTIGESAFSGCSALTSITLPEGLVSIGGSAFSSCGFSSIVIPSTVTSIGGQAFNGTGSADGSVTFADGSAYNVVNETTFYCSNFGTIILPDCITEIKQEGICECPNLKSLPLADKSNLTTLGDMAICECPSISSLVIPASVTTIGGNAFNQTGSADGCLTFAEGSIYTGENDIEAFKGTYFGTVVLPESMTTLGEYSFWNATCKSITIPASVEKVGTGSFANCKKLQEMIIFCTTPPAFFGERGPFDPGTFENISTDAVLVVPNGAADDYAATEWNALTIKEGEPLDVTEVGWASFYTGDALDIPSCAKVYYASAASGSTLTLTEITGTIPAETAVIVQIPAGTLFPRSSSNPAAIEGNLLRGTLTDITRTEEVYVLSPASSKESPVFQNYTGAKLGANKAYILKSDLDPAASNMLRFVFGEATHIEAVSTDDTNADAPMYNMAGQRVSDDYRGLVIKNGKKMWNN